MNETFTIRDLKDGMIVTYRNGRNRYFAKGFLYGVGKVFYEKDSETETNTLEKYNDDLTHKDNNSFDIVKAEYMEEVIWKRQEKEYLTLAEAVATGKRIKHKDTEDFSCYLYKVFNFVDGIKAQDDNANYKDRNEFLLEQMNLKVWEVRD